MVRGSQQRSCRRYEKRTAGNHLIWHAASLRTVVQICILTAAMFTESAVDAFKHWQQQQKRSDIPWRATDLPSSPRLDFLRNQGSH